MSTTIHLSDLITPTGVEMIAHGHDQSIASVQATRGAQDDEEDGDDDSEATSEE